MGRLMARLDQTREVLVNQVVYGHGGDNPL
jgi:hypothetical protein